MKTFKTYLLGQELSLTISDGQTISINTAEPTEEGWSSTAITYQYNQYEGVIKCATIYDGRDCDGRLTTTTVSICKDTELDTCEGKPNWQKVESSQYDEFAEMAGY